MRPISKGTAPRSYREYGDAQPDLIRQVGRFCSYCERKIPSSIAVEHKRPKDIYPRYELEWDNFLLSCPNCNSAKSKKRVTLSLYLWPDSDNTFWAFEYTQDGIVIPRQSLPRWIRRKASRTIFMLGLDKHPGHHREPTDRDYRWADRREQWQKAVTAREQLKLYDTPDQRFMIIQFAKDGIFSIWMEVFKDDVDMRQRLINAFPGTACDCFDAHCKVVVRPGGKF